MFITSNKMVNGDGDTASFWEDRWLDGRAISEIAPKLLMLVFGRTRKRWTTRDAFTDRRWISNIREGGATYSMSTHHIWRLFYTLQLAPTQTSPSCGGHWMHST